MTLLHDKILAKVINTENKTESGIYTGYTDRISNGIAIVTLVSDKVKYVAVGDKIKYNVNTAQELTLDGKNMVCVRESQDLIYKF